MQDTISERTAGGSFGELLVPVVTSQKLIPRAVCYLHVLSESWSKKKKKKNFWGLFSFLLGQAGAVQLYMMMKHWESRFFHNAGASCWLSNDNATCILARFSKQQSGHFTYLNGINVYSEKANLESCGGVWGFQDGRMGNHLGEVDDINTPSVQDKASVVSPRLLVVQRLAVIWLTHSKSLDTKVISGTAQTCLNACNCINVTMYLDNNHLWRCETILSVSRFFCLFVCLLQNRTRHHILRGCYSSSSRFVSHKEICGF